MWVQLNEVKPTTAATVEAGTTPFTTTITMTQGANERIPFVAQGGQVVEAQANKVQDAKVDPLLILLDDKGKPITFNDDVASDNSNAAITDYVISASGTYTLVVSYAGGGSEGDIQVLLDLKSAVPEATGTIIPTMTPTPAS